MEDSPGAVRDEDTSGNTVTEQVKTQTQQVVQQTQDKASQVAGQATDRAQSMLEGRKQQGADSIASVAQALRQTGQTLRDQDQGTVAQVADRAADQVERFSGYLRERNVNDIVGEVEGMARSNPAVFLGGAFAVGVFLGRFLKSSSPSQTSGGGTDQGSYRYGNMPYRYEDVRGAPSVQRGYASGQMSRGTGYGAADASYETGTSDYGTGMASYTPPVSAAGTFDEDIDTVDPDLGATGDAYRSGGRDVRTGDGA